MRTIGAEGWWLASDGKWYPPEAQRISSALLPPPPVPVEPGSSKKPWWKHWWVAALAGVLGIGLVGAFVSQSDQGVNGGESSLSTTATRSTGDSTVATSEPSTSSPAEPVGTRAQPDPIGEPANFKIQAIGDADGSVWVLEVDGPGTDVTRDVAEANSFNPEPAEGSLFVGVPILVSSADRPTRRLRITRWTTSTRALRVAFQPSQAAP